MKKEQNSTAKKEAISAPEVRPVKRLGLAKIEQPTDRLTKKATPHDRQRDTNMPVSETVDVRPAKIAPSAPESEPALASETDENPTIDEKTNPDKKTEPTMKTKSGKGPVLAEIRPQKTAAIASSRAAGPPEVATAAAPKKRRTRKTNKPARSAKRSGQTAPAAYRQRTASKLGYLLRPNTVADKARKTAAKAIEQASANYHAALFLLALMAVLFRLCWTPLAYSINFFSRAPIAGYAIGQILRLTVIYLLPLLLLRKQLVDRPLRLTGAGKTNFHTVLQTALTGVIAALFLRGLHNLSVYLLTSLEIIVLDSVLPAYPSFTSPAAFFTCFLIQVPASAICETLLFTGLLAEGLNHRGNRADLRVTNGHMTRVLMISLIAGLSAPYALSGLVPFLLCLFTLRLRLIYDDLKVALSFNLSVRTVLLLLQLIVPRFDSNFIFLELTGSKISLWVSLLFVGIGAIALYLNWSDTEKHAPAGRKSKWFLRKNRLSVSRPDKVNIRKRLSTSFKALHPIWYIAVAILLTGLLLGRFLAG